jgi:two-component system sensor histidine kinase/response regulator
MAEDKDELLGILTHDLKNHLGGMQMSAQLLHDRASELTEPRLTRMSTNILNASNQMFSFVKEFLANTAADRGYILNLEVVSSRHQRRPPPSSAIPRPRFARRS